MILSGWTDSAERKRSTSLLRLLIMLKLVVADGKLNLDDNAAFRQKKIFALPDRTQEHPREF
ncbi:hypothetical protein C5167_040747 [Papaver somniferum]|uniref:Uncharacterized protein n=1 Tax=Papaver somniferum TaxID=3469 RepID=A0A4Y7IFW8_PAPSO|nr:hypothetical protein C5167_040747 [Papaver somniferum]